MNKQTVGAAGERRQTAPSFPSLLRLHSFCGRLLVFGSLARAPSDECGRCLRTKLGFTHFAARLFWRLGEQWHLAVNVFDALPPHAVAGRYP
jgi:hypothetical protein